jgi:large subunit ribosomal protein L23
MSKDPYSVVYHPYVTEKAMNLMTGAKEVKKGGKVVKTSPINSLVFIVDRRANKKDIKEAIEKLFEVKVERVNTFISREGKHAIVKFTKEYSAEDIGTRIGIF